MSEANVCVVIPCYRVTQFIGNTIQSLLVQKFTNWRAVIVNDGCPDMSHESMINSIATDSRLSYIPKKNGGVASARNFGYQYKKVHEKYVLFLDGDDMLKVDALEKMVAYLEAHPKVGLLHCEAEVINEGGELIKRDLPVRRWSFNAKELPPTEPLTPFESIYTLSFIIPSVCLLRCDVFEQTGGYNEDFGHNMEDTDLHLRMALLAPVHFLPERLVCYRIRLGQSSANVAALNEQAAKLWKRWSTIDILTKEQKELVTRAEYFRTNELVFLHGFAEARRYFANNRWYKALRFWFGAMRRLIAIRFTSKSL